MPDAPRSLAQALEAARAALAAAARDVDFTDPFAASVVRGAAHVGAEDRSDALLTHWSTRSAGAARGPLRYRWEVSHARGTTIPAWCGPPETWRAWHAREQDQVDGDPCAFEEARFLPVMLTTTCTLLARAAAGATPHAELAAELLEEAEPPMRRDFASYVQALHPWSDTFALAALVRDKPPLDRLHPLAVAIAETYAAAARRTDGAVLGQRYPFHHARLASASAQLATGLRALGAQVPLVARLVEHVVEQRTPEGAFRDGDHPPDLLTTYVCADLLTGVDPEFDPGASLDWMIAQQGEDGFFRAYGPEAPWLTDAVVRLLESVARPFAERFQWPRLSKLALDQKTGVPGFAHFADLADVFAGIDGLARADTEIAFLDLARFKGFNDRFGQDRGDDVLFELAQTLEGLGAARVVRDGGDEFLIVGAPTREGLARDLDALRAAWPARFAACFGADVPTVAPRVVLTRTRGAGLGAAREMLGRAIGGLKDRSKECPPDGVLEVV